MLYVDEPVLFSSSIVDLLVMLKFLAIDCLFLRFVFDFV
jgi:hypothetical protein